MAKVRSPWRVLRPLLLAGALTVAWLTLSSSAATADSSKDPGSFLGGVKSSVSSLSAPLTGAVTQLAEFHAPAAPAALPAGILQPAVGNLSHTADQLIAAVPVVNGVVPSGTVSTVTAPVTAIADGAVAGLVDAAVPPLVDAVPALEPVMQPVADLVTGATPLTPVVTGVLNDSHAFLSAPAPETAGPASSSEEPARALENSEALSGTVAGSSGADLTGVPLAAGSPGVSAPPAAPADSDAEGPVPSPVPAPAGPGTGSGSGASPSGPSGAAAWLNAVELGIPLSGTFPINGALAHAPSPVSFDPGSSPD